MTDFLFANHGSVCILTPVSEQAKEWADEHIDPDAQRWCGGVVIEPRYVQPILDGIMEEGMDVS